MGYDRNGRPKPPQINKQLQPELPSADTKVNVLKGDGYFLFDPELKALYMAGVIDPDGNVVNEFLSYCKYGQVDDIEMLRQFSTNISAVSTDSITYTVPAGYIRVFLSVSYTNNTRNFGYEVKVQPSGGSEITVIEVPSGRTSAFMYDIYGVGYMHTRFLRVLDEGGTLTVTDPAFVAGDNVLQTASYVDILKV